VSASGPTGRGGNGVEPPPAGLEISEEEILRRKQFLAFGRDDEVRLRGIHPLAERYADSLISAFYDHLLAFEDARTVFRDPLVLKRVKKLQRDYFLRLTQGNYDHGYVRDRLKIGAVHERIGLPVKSYLGMYCFYLCAAALRLMEAQAKNPRAALESFLSLMKLTFLDISLAIDTYIASRERTIRSQQEAFQDQLKSIAENIPGTIFRRVLKSDGTISHFYVSGGFRELFGVEPGAFMRGESLLLELIHPDDRAAFEAATALSATDLTRKVIEFRIRTPIGEARWVKSVSRPRRLEDGTIVCDGVMLDITDRKELEADRDFLAYYDQLTRLPNRLLLLDRLGQTIEHSDRAGVTAVVVAALELSALKGIRDSQGLAAGDAVIRELAKRLRATVQAGDTIAHLGDGQFMLILTGIRRGADFTTPLQEIVKRCSQPFDHEGRQFQLRLQIGVSVGPEDGIEAEVLMRNATTALNRVKDLPGQMFQFYSSHMTERAVHRLGVEAELHRAFEKGEFVLHYQPQVAARTFEIVGAEALIRWRHPDRGLIPPAEFIPVAEETGLIVPLGEIVLRSACDQTRKWPHSELKDFTISVNLSGRQLLEEDLGDRVLAIVRESGLPPRCLTLELTESMILHNAEAAAQIMGQLAAEGVRFSVDDFGIEHSALSHLSRLPIEALKIDHSFVWQMTEDSAHAALVQAIISMTRAMGMHSVAEGVETLTQLTYLQAYQCDVIQGFLFSKPVPAELFLPLLERRVIAPVEER